MITVAANLGRPVDLGPLHHHMVTTFFFPTATTTLVYDQRQQFKTGTATKKGLRALRSPRAY